MAKRLGVPESSYRHAERGNAGKTFFREEVRARLREMLGEELAEKIYDGWEAGRKTTEAQQDTQVVLPPRLVHVLSEARVTRFHPSRAYYQQSRDGRGSITDYISGAVQSVEMVSINLASGHEIEMLADCFETLICTRKPPVRVRVSLIDPELEFLAEAIASVIGTTPATLRSRVQDTLGTLTALKSNRLSRSRLDYLEVWCHRCLPNGSAIILDGDAPNGLFQLETKGYRTGMNKSFGFEVAAGSDFFRTLRDSYRNLMEDGRRIC